MTNQSPQVGWWVYFCCEEDLHQIENETDLEDYLTNTTQFNYHPTKEAALNEIGSED